MGKLRHVECGVKLRELPAVTKKDNTLVVTTSIDIEVREKNCYLQQNDEDYPMSLNHVGRKMERLHSMSRKY